MPAVLSAKTVQTLLSVTSIFHWLIEDALLSRRMCSILAVRTKSDSEVAPTKWRDSILCAVARSKFSIRAEANVPEAIEVSKTGWRLWGHVTYPHGYRQVGEQQVTGQRELDLLTSLQANLSYTGVAHHCLGRLQ